VLDLSVIVNNFAFLVVQGLLGVGNFTGGTLRLAIPAIVLGFSLGIFIGIARLARSRWISLPATLYVEFFRGVPLVMVIFWIWFIIPQLLRFPIPEYGVALAAFVIFEAAYFGEIVRAGIQSVPRGQVEAATALGLTRPQSMRFVVLPQAIRNMVPSLVTQMIVLFKDTSLASIIGYVDLTKAAQIVNNREIRPFELYLCTDSMSLIAARFEHRPA
jgi:His/Glu/Gln/Arg/opine family amino acid ABC transporter permease subunit